LQISTFTLPTQKCSILGISLPNLLKEEGCMEDGMAYIFRLPKTKKLDSIDILPGNYGLPENGISFYCPFKI